MTQILKIDAVEHWLGNFIAEKIEKGIELPIDIEASEITGFNGINLREVLINDLAGDTLIYAAEGNVNISPVSLFKDVIEINTLTLASPRLSIKQETADSKSNVQLLIEHILKQKKQQEEKRIGVKINQIHIYDGVLSYDILEMSDKKPGFLPSHIRLSDFTFNASVREVGAEKADIYIRRLSFRERSGFELKRLKMEIEATPSNISLSNIALSLPSSMLQSDKVDIDLTDKKSPHISGNIYSDGFHTDDIRAFTYGILGGENLIFELDSEFSLSNNDIEISGLTIKDGRGGMHISANGYAKGIKDETPEAFIDIVNIDAEKESLERIYSIVYRNIAKNDSAMAGKMPSGEEIFDILTNLSLKGEIYYKGKDMHASIGIESNVGDASINFNNEKSGKYCGTIQAGNIAVKEIVQGGECKMLDLYATVEGEYRGKSDFNGILNSTISNLIFKEYQYSPINISADFTNKKIKSRIKTEDKNLTAYANIAYNSQQNSATINAVVDAFAPTSLNLAKEKEYGTFSFILNSNHLAKSAKEQQTTVKFKDIDVLRENEMFHIDKIDLFDEINDNSHTLAVYSDAMHANVTGNFKYSDLGASIEKIIAEELSAIQDGSKKREAVDNNYVFIVNFERPDVICDILRLPIKISGPTMLEGECVDNNSRINLHADITDLQYGNNILDKITISTTTKEEGIVCNASAIVQRPTKDDTNNKLWISLSSLIDNNNIDNNIYWHTTDSTANNGNLSFRLGIEKRNSEMCYKTVIEPSSITMNRNIWNMSESTIEVIGKKILVSDFGIKSNENGIHINGIAGEHSGDSITMELNNIEIEDLFNTINYRGLKVGGRANGKIIASNIFTDLKTDIDADVNDCTFFGGKLGNLAVSGEWSSTQKGLRFYGNAKEDGIATTILDGYVSEEFDSLELKILAHNTSAGFLGGMIPSILTDIDVRTNGAARIGGRFDNLVLEGDLELTGKLRITSTDVLYSISNDSIYLRDGGIDFRRMTVRDMYGNIGYLNGSVTHRSFKNFACDLDVDAHNLQAIDFKNENNTTFYGTAYATGDVNILFTPKDGLFITGNAVPTSSSKIVYNASGPLGATNSEFVTFTDRSEKSRKILTETSDISGKNSKDIGASRTNIDIRINDTKNVELLIYTNAATGDYINLFGGGGDEEGSVRVMYNEKSDLELEGTLNVERGTYKLTLQDIFHKDFAIQNGSTIHFAGNPFDAVLNLKTKYNIPSVSLSDLDLSAGKRKNVSVNCLMDIGGTMGKPALTFGIELQTGNEEDRELLASAASTPEQINMQFIYLLGIGKFYTYDYNQGGGNTQSSTAMESLLSTTLSGQINNMLSQIIDNNNWNFSGNISTSERGWNSMEVDGILQGRLLNNRLLINGNLGYRENPVSSNNFIGDFEVQWLWLNSANADLSLKAYNKTNDRYFTKTSLNTQGVGITARYEFDKWRYIFGGRKAKKEEKRENQK